MAIRQLSLTDFRNLASATLELHPRINLVHGVNAAGKTSLLEALYVLCQGQSFRTHQLAQCVQYGKPGFLLFGRFDDFKAGISKRGRRLEIRVDGATVGRRSELVRKAPINIVNADSFEQIDGPPGVRRRFVDWYLFHVEHDYADAWNRFQHALRQRNRLLKDRRDLDLLDYWDEHLVEPSERLAAMRRRCANALQVMLGTEMESLLAGFRLELEYRTGWPDGRALSDVLAAERKRDIAAGYTRFGIQRDDLLLRVEGRPAGEILSRGQAKRLCLAMLLAALTRVGQAVSKRIVLLIDDLHSELDPSARQRVYERLQSLDLQLFISNIDATLPAPIAAEEFKMFHVEHGIIKPRNFS